LSELLEPREGIIFRSYSPSGLAGRMYFTDENGRRIDAILAVLRSSLEKDLLSRTELYLLLALLIDAADRVANISGTYGAYLKKWQASSRARLSLRPFEIVESALDHRAYRRDANELISELEGDVLYIDPPYNSRQYPANYHVLEVIAEYPEVEDSTAYEASLYGKTGLRPYAEERSLYCIEPGARRSSHGHAGSALHHLINTANVDHIVVSYNEEGILGIDDIVEFLAEFSGARPSKVRGDLRPVGHRRFRSDRDRDGSDGQGKRSYRRLEGRGRDEIEEWLFYARRAKRQASYSLPN